MSETLPSGAPRRYTAEDLMTPEMAGLSVELLEGELIPMSPTKGPHQLVVSRLLRILVVHHASLEPEKRRALEIVSAEGGFIVGGDSVLAPDIAVARHEAVVAAAQADRFTEGAPLVAIEVLSDSNRRRDVLRRTELLLGAGAEQVWLVSPSARSIHVESSHMVVPEVFRLPEVLVGHGTLEGLRIPLAELFAEE